GWTPPSSLMFIAVGGAHVAPTLLAQAQAKGLPVFEGYGLSEAVSVSTLNTPNCNTMGSAGKTLGHNQLHIEEGEIVVTGNHFLGYLNQPSSFYPTQVRTGDLGFFSDNTLTLNGRIKNIMVNSFGRNVSPEWIESLLLGTGLFRQALVYCEAKPYCVALLVPASNTISNTQIQSTVALINKQLPDYAQVVNFATIGLCTPENQLLTPTGKLKRDAIIARYATDLDMLYQGQDQHQYSVQSTTAFSSQFVIKE
ncbi:MAG: AMP-dependent synthetase, partial [Pseudomonadota bacterium]|nr:AMP-dependent synthetase [Pseudomonadota bacterium]